MKENTDLGRKEKASGTSLCSVISLLSLHLSLFTGGIRVGSLNINRGMSRNERAASMGFIMRKSLDVALT